MIKYQVLCDPNAKENGSSNIIVSNINEAAKKLGLYSDGEGAVRVFYDCLCQTHGQIADVIWSAYELPFPAFLIESLARRPMLGLSRDNAMMAIAGGYPDYLVNYVSLGVDSEKWKYCYRQNKQSGDPFTFLCACESNTRSAFEVLIPTFCTTFSGNRDVRLYLKDRNATDQFKEWVFSEASHYNVDIVHDDRDLSSIEDQLDIFSKCDAFVCVNHSHTFGMNRLQALSCGIPLITTHYQGGREYLQEGFCGTSVNYDLFRVDNHVINSLIHGFGLKNHLFPINENAPFESFWSYPNKVSLQKSLLEIYSKKDSLIQMSKNARTIACWHSWDRAAANMSVVLNNWFKQTRI